MFIFVRLKQIFVINNGDFFLLLVVITGIRYRNLIPDTNLKGGLYSTSTAADLLAAMIYHCFAETQASWIQHYILSHWIFWVTRLVLNYQTVQVLTGNYFLLLLYFGCTTNQRNIPYGCLLHLLLQRHQGPLLCLLESPQLKKLMQHETSGQEILQQLIYRHSWRPFWTCCWDLPV